MERQICPPRYLCYQVYHENTKRKVTRELEKYWSFSCWHTFKITFLSFKRTVQSGLLFCWVTRHISLHNLTFYLQRPVSCKYKGIKRNLQGTHKFFFGSYFIAPIQFLIAKIDLFFFIISFPVWGCKLAAYELYCFLWENAVLAIQSLSGSAHSPLSLVFNCPQKAAQFIIFKAPV